MALAIPAVLASCSKDPELPYDLEGTTHTFAISVTKATEYDLLLNAGSTDGNYYVKLQAPENMGDFSSYLKEVQVLCVYTSVSGDVSSAIAAEGVTSIPAEVKIDMPALCEKLGIPSPTIGDKMQFTANIIHKDGTVVPGWTSTMGFNFRAPTFFTMADGSDFSYCATYTAAAPLQQTYYQGGNTVGMIAYDDMVEDYVSTTVDVAKVATIPDDVIKPGFTAEDYIGLELSFDLFGYGKPAKFTVYINKKDYSVYAPNTTVAEADPSWILSMYGTGGPINFTGFNGELNTLTNVLDFVVTARWTITEGVYTGYSLGWGTVEYVIDFSDVQ